MVSAGAVSSASFVAATDVMAAVASSDTIHLLRTVHWCADAQVTIREGNAGEVNVHGAKEESVSSAEEMLMLLERGSLCRTTGSTLMNAHSSRRCVRAIKCSD